jgi:hypothetical protein
VRVQQQLPTRRIDILNQSNRNADDMELLEPRVLSPSHHVPRRCLLRTAPTHIPH